MPTLYNVPASEIISRTSEYLKKNILEVSPPQWTAFVKTGAHVENPPQHPDWWHIRCASLLRKIYLEGPIGIARLKKEYGGRDWRGTIGKHRKSGGGAIIRNALQQLEKAGLVETVETKGRRLTPKGISLLDSLAAEAQKDLERSDHELKKYR